MRKSILISWALLVGGIVSPHLGVQVQAQDTSSVRLNRTIALLEQNQPVFGIFSRNHSLGNAHTLAQSRLDFVIVDMEHAPFDVETLRSFLLGMTNKRALHERGTLQPQVTPIVRIPMKGTDGIRWAIEQALDAGAFGVTMPFVETRAQAKAAVRAARYAHEKGQPDRQPRGLRGFSPVNAVWYWGLSTSEYRKRADLWPLDSEGELLLILQIESRRGIENIDEILSVPGIGAVFVGPFDLSVSLGHPGDSDAPEVEAAIETVLDACRRHEVPCGIHATEATVEQRVQQGFSVVTVGTDRGLNAAAANALQRGRTAAQQ